MWVVGGGAIFVGFFCDFEVVDMVLYCIVGLVFGGFIEWEFGAGARIFVRIGIQYAVIDAVL